MSALISSDPGRLASGGQVAAAWLTLTCVCVADVGDPFRPRSPQHVLVLRVTLQPARFRRFCHHQLPPSLRLHTCASR